MSQKPNFADIVRGNKARAPAPKPAPKPLTVGNSFVYNVNNVKIFVPRSKAQTKPDVGHLFASEMKETFPEPQPVLAVNDEFPPIEGDVTGPIQEFVKAEHTHIPATIVSSPNTYFIKFGPTTLPQEPWAWLQGQPFHKGFFVIQNGLVLMATGQMTQHTTSLANLIKNYVECFRITTATTVGMEPFVAELAVGESVYLIRELTNATVCHQVR